MSGPYGRAFSLCLVAVAVLAAPASADSFGFADFSDVSAFTLNGDAAQVGDVIRLTPALNSQGGSAFLTTPLNFGATDSIETMFRYRIHGGGGTNGSDGMAFVVHSDPRGASALGHDGGDLGYGDPGEIKPSFAVEFDTHRNGADPNHNHVALHLDGKPEQAAVVWGSPAWLLNDGNSQYAWVDYDGLLKQISVFVSQTSTKPGTALFSYGIDLNAVVGTSVYFGFTAGTGGGFNHHDVESWSLTVPEPGALVLLGAGLVAWLLLRRRLRVRRP